MQFVARFSLTVLLVLNGLLIAQSQNLEEISIHKGVKVNGSMNLNTIGYWARGIQKRRDPFNWFFTGSININAFGYNAPFSFSYSNANKSYSQPFNQFSFAPQYKWIRAYIGYNSMTFSNYTLNGHVFLGGGVDLTPGKWRISAMYGRLKKAVAIDPLDTLHYNNVAYKRMGYGLKIGYDDNGNSISANIFTAKDDVTSILFTPPESQVTPQQNVAMSIAGRKKLFSRFFIEAEYAISVMNKDIHGNVAGSDTTTRMPTNNVIQGLLPENSTSRYYDALNASAGYQGNWYTMQLRYERIAPEYQTLGAYYFNNDMRNITIVPSLRLLKGRLNVAGNVGFQQNNLDKTRSATTKRFVGSTNTSYSPNELWNFAVNYSNFSSYTNTRPQIDPYYRNNLDTLNFYQVSKTTGLSVLRNLGKKKSPQNIMLNVSYQKASNHANSESGNQQSNFLTTTISYSYSFVPSNTTLALSGNVYKNNAAGIQTIYWGPTLSVTKGFLEKTLRTTLTSSYNETSGDVKSSPVLSNRLNFIYTPKGKEESTTKHNFSLAANVLRRFEGTPQQPAYTELTGMFNYSYTF
jgi:hypothetical protein